MSATIDGFVQFLYSFLWFLQSLCWILFGFEWFLSFLFGIWWVAVGGTRAGDYSAPEQALVLMVAHDYLRPRMSCTGISIRWKLTVALVIEDDGRRWPLCASGLQEVVKVVCQQPSFCVLQPSLFFSFACTLVAVGLPFSGYCWFASISGAVMCGAVATLSDAVGGRFFQGIH